MKENKQKLRKQTFEKILKIWLRKMHFSVQSYEISKRKNSHLRRSIFTSRKKYVNDLTIRSIGCISIATIVKLFDASQGCLWE